jgi:hypothetical protein
MKIIFGRRLNTNTMMWEFSDGSGVAVADELMPRPGDSVDEWFRTKDRLERAASHDTKGTQ